MTNVSQNRMVNVTIMGHTFTKNGNYLEEYVIFVKQQYTYSQ